MNRLASFLGLLLLFFSCTSPVQEKSEAAELYLTGTRETIEVGSGSNVIPISFSTNQSWTARPDVSWISLSSGKGSAGDAAIVATVEENRTEAARSGNVTITAGSASKSIQITQSSAGGTSTSETLVLTARISDYTTFTVSVTTNSTRSYFFDVVEKSVWDKDGGEAVWKSRFRKDAVLNKNGSRQYTDQKAKTEYLAFAAFCDANGTRTGGFYTESFITDTGLGGNDPTPITLSVSSLTASSFVLNASSKSSDKYFFSIAEKDTWDTYGAETVWQASVKILLDAGSFVSKLASGEASYKYDGLKTSKYVAFAAYCYNDGKLKSTIFTKEIDLTNIGQDRTPDYVWINTNLALLPGESRTLVAECYDSDSQLIETAKVKWSSSNSSVATVDQDGVVKAIKAGRATITAKAVNGTASKEAAVYVVADFSQPVNLGLSVKWAQCNIGTSRPEGYGRYYEWGAAEPWSGMKITTPYYFQTSYWDSHKNEIVDDDLNLYRSKDPVKQLVGKNWRLPTKKEFEELFENCSKENIRINGIPGCLFLSQKPGYTGQWLFLPCSGICWAGWAADPERDKEALYWSSTIVDYAIYNMRRYEPAWGLYIYSMNSYNNGINCEYLTTGCPVRPVYSDELYFDLIVSDIKSTQCKVSAGTNSSDKYYLYFVSKALWNEYGAEQIWQAIVKLEKDAGSFASSLQTGDQTFSITDLNAKTEYVVFAAFCNQNGTRKGQIYSKSFKTN